MRKLLPVLLMALFLSSAPPAHAQKWEISTNALDYINLGTLNIEGGYAVAQHWSVHLGARYNPFAFGSEEKGYFQNKKQSYSAGARWWAWHTWSGLWISGKAQYMEYNSGGILADRAEEGDAFGGSLAAGYTYMVTPHLNVDFGAGVWAGMKYYARYSCPRCGITVDRGSKPFVMPNDFMVSLSYVF